MSTIVVDPYLADLDKLFPGRDRSRQLPERNDEGMKVSTLLIIMSAISLACVIGERLLPETGLGAGSLAIGSIARSVAGPSATAFLGIGLSIVLARKCGDSSERRCMLLPPMVALAIGAIIACLVHVADCSSPLGWLLSPVYLLWAWGSAVSGR
jgi:hypothetical protein